VWSPLKRRVRLFLTVRRGARFRARYRRLQQQRRLASTLLAIGLGLLLLALGLVLLVLPGPGLLVATLGAALIAGESSWLARLLDRVDLWLLRWRDQVRRATSR
jgi:hypothetical protein